MLSNLLSGVFGAVIAIFIDRVIEAYENKRDAKKLCSIFVNDLLMFIRMGELNDQNVADIIQKSILSKNLWRNLAPEMLRLLPMHLLQKTIVIYSSFELLTQLETVDRRHEQYKNIKTQADSVVKELAQYAGIDEK